MKWPRSDRLTYKARNPRKAICQSSEYVFPIRWLDVRRQGTVIYDKKGYTQVSKLGIFVEDMSNTDAQIKLFKNDLKMCIRDRHHAVCELL